MSDPVGVLRDGLALLDECPYRDAVDPGMHSGCEFCADREDERAALADVEALVAAADELRLWQPGRKGYAAAQARLFAALRPFGDSDKEPAA